MAEVLASHFTKMFRKDTKPNLVAGISNEGRVSGATDIGEPHQLHSFKQMQLLRGCLSNSRGATGIKVWMGRGGQPQSRPIA
jgi:hypothetical protein